MTTGHCESSLCSFDELQNSAQAAVDPQTKPPDLGCESACSAAIVYNHHRRLLLLLSPLADTHLLSHVGQKAELT